MNRNEAEQIASAMTLIRPDWLRTSLVTILGRHQHRPARDVMLALVWVAYDPDTRTPARIDADGPWWQTARLAGTDLAIVPPSRLHCPMHQRPEPCSECAPPVPPHVVKQRMAEARAAIRAAREGAGA